MTEVAFNKEIIGELRVRAIAHNEAVSHAEDRVKIGQLKGLYKGFFNGPDPHRHALQKLDAHLERIRLKKAREPFDPGRHPRGRSGEFRGSGPPSPPPPNPDRGPDRGDPLLTAAQTQVIPETRYSVFGPGVAAVAGVGLGAIGGASASYHGNPVDRLVTRGLSAAGAKVGNISGELVALVPNALHGVADFGVRRLNRSLGTRVPRPRVPVSEAGKLAARTAGAKGGRFVGQKIGRAAGFLYSAPAATARRGALLGFSNKGSLEARLAGGAAGAIVGGIFPGALIYAPALHDAQARIGPYEDTLFPRRVKKMAGPLINAPEVLAKQAEILADATLTKINAGAAIARISRLFSGRARVASAAVRPLTEPQQAAQTIFERHRPQVSVRTKRQMLPALAIHAAPYAVGGTALGAGLGAIGGAARAHFDDKHPRDRRGRFSRKAEATIGGAKLGAAIGLGLGLAGGVVAARAGHTGLLTAALARLRGAQPGELNLPDEPNLHGTPGNLPAVMENRAKRGARIAHAIAFQARNSKAVPHFGTRIGSEPEHIITSLKTHFGKRFADSLMGQALAANTPRAWYRYQLDNAFDAVLSGANSGRNLWRLGPVADKAGNALPRTASNLIDTIDPGKFNPAQRKIWDDVAEKYAATKTHIDDIYAKRGNEARTLGDQLAATSARKETIASDISQVPVAWARLSRNPATDLEAVRNFARNELNAPLPRTVRTKEAAIAHVNAEALPAWNVRHQEELDALSAELDPDAGLLPQHEAAVKAQMADLAQTEIEPIKNPFGMGSRYFLKPRPQESFQALRNAAGDKGAQSFIDENETHAAEAETHLHSLLAAQEEALAARIPGASAGQRFFAVAAPMLAPHLKQVVADLNALKGASTSRLDQAQLAMRAWASGNVAGMKAWAVQNGLARGTAWQRSKAVHRLAMQNWKAITSIVAAGSAFGIIDANAPWVVQFDRRKWNRPKMAIVHELPDVMRRPHEAVFGVSYRTRDNQTRFLHGVYVKNAAGDHQSIPFGADVNAVLNSVRGGHGLGSGGGGNAPLPVQNAREVGDALARLRTAGHIKSEGPKGFEFEQRVGGNGDAEKDLAQTIRKSAIDFMQRPDFLQRNPQLVDKSTNRPNIFYDQGLFQIFNHPMAPVLGLAARAQLLVGNHLPANDPNYHRGLFGGTSVHFPAPARADGDEIRNRLVAQLRSPNIEPNDPAKYIATRQAMWTVGEYYKLSDRDVGRIKEAVDTQYRRAAGAEPPTSVADVQASANEPKASREAEVLADHLVAMTPVRERPVGMESDAALHDTLLGLYEARRSTYMREHRGENNLDDHAHHEADRHVRQWLGDIQKADAAGDLRKIAGSAIGIPRRRIAAAAQPAAQGDVADETDHASRVAPVIPPIARSAARQAAVVRAPATPAAPSVAHQIRQAVRPAHAANQLGTYGGGAAGAELFSGLAEGLIPGSRIAGPIAGVAGGLLGTGVGGRLGKPSKDQQSLGETAARGVAGGVAQIAAYKGFTKVGLKSLTAVARTAASGLRGAGAGAAAGAEEGAAVGGVLTPEFAGAGAIPGAVIGTGLGALAGYLTDEGVGMLYHHLRRYGAHVPAHVLGIRPNQRAARPAGAVT